MVNSKRPCGIPAGDFRARTGQIVADGRAGAAAAQARRCSRACGAALAADGVTYLHSRVADLPAVVKVGAFEEILP